MAAPAVEEVPAEVSWAIGFRDTFKGFYETANLAGLASLYGADSIMSVDGTMVTGVASIGGLIMPRTASGPVMLRVISTDGQMTPGGQLLTFMTGDSSVPAARFTEAFLLSPLPAGGMYIQAELLRFGPGSVPFNTAADTTAIGANFAAQYYKTYTENRLGLAALYRETSKLTFEGKIHTGLASIAERLGSMPKGTHVQETLDVVQVGTSMMIMVTGRIVLEGEANPLHFSQVFVLGVDAAGPHITNEMYRFVYG